ncbi:hypothetical protein CPB83DRAFT_840458 [Crepidotus variabilis]|uniref:Uncharacterized protein n=1 Tax=Crepidotus variabilis TaxID=179855 RepID=A0A9P6JIY7_9AGAR|nr:hypothetical protein CPB83DRAFT_840458 [Crepidotus variabilis]
MANSNAFDKRRPSLLCLRRLGDGFVERARLTRKRTPGLIHVPISNSSTQTSSTSASAAGFYIIKAKWDVKPPSSVSFNTLRLIAHLRFIALDLVRGCKTFKEVYDGRKPYHPHRLQRSCHHARYFLEEEQPLFFKIVGQQWSSTHLQLYSHGLDMFITCSKLLFVKSSGGYHFTEFCITDADVTEINIIEVKSGESAKSTIVKQMKILHQDSFTEPKLKDYKPTICRNGLE